MVRLSLLRLGLANQEKLGQACLSRSAPFWGYTQFKQRFIFTGANDLCAIKHEKFWAGDMTYDI